MKLKCINKSDQKKSFEEAMKNYFTPKINAETKVLIAKGPISIGYIMKNH
jgi:hypothetical protein